MYKSKIHYQSPDFSRDLKHAVNRAPTGLACAFQENNIFIPFINISPTHVQFNVGKPINKNEIPGGLSGLTDLLIKENINDSQWILGNIEKKLFLIRMTNRMFKEKSYELNIDFILHFGNNIKKKAWSKENFELAISDLNLEKYYFLELDDKGTYGIPVAFCVWNDNYYVCINNQHQYMGAKKFFKQLKEKSVPLKTSKIMDWNNKHNLLLFDEDKAKFNEKLFKKINLIDINEYDKETNYIVDSSYIGQYIMIKMGNKLFPTYILNQNYIRFNNRIVNVCSLHNFLESQRYNFGNYFIPEKGTKANKIKLFIKYNFTLHHIHDDNFKKDEYQQYQQQKKEKTNKQKNHQPPKRMSKIVSKAINRTNVNIFCVYIQNLGFGPMCFTFNLRKGEMSLTHLEKKVFPDSPN